VDVWRFDELLRKAASGEAVRESLEAAAEICRSELLKGVYYEWAERLRAHFQDQLLDVLVQLAEVCKKNGDEEAAVTALNRAISLDPYAEQIYRTLMELYAKLGSIAEIERACRELEAELSEGLDAEPTDETNTLKTSLLRQLTHSSDV
jgi:DNA-binding SARP family transcriptional activator